MYNIFKLPNDFLNREYTPEEKETFEKAIQDYYHGTGEHLTEDLTDKQKAKVDNYWDGSHAVKKAHDEVFGDKDRIVVPYDSSLDKPITSENFTNVVKQRGIIGTPHHHTIFDKLHEHGYRTDDYAAGLAYHKDAPERKLKIASVLSKIGIADTLAPHWSKKTKLKESRQMTHAEVFAADPIRGAAKKDKHVIITRNKYDVAGMSTGRGWTSCMNLDDGVNRHYVKHDIENGTLTAYLCTKDDDGIHHPIGRINLKRFNNVATNHISYQPENSQYGTIPQQFPEIVASWSKKHYPMKDAGIYQKAPELYDDDGVTMRTHKLHELDTEKALHATTESLLDSTLKAVHGNYDNLKHDDYDRDSVGTTTESTMEKYHNQLSGNQYAHSLIHWASDMSNQGYGNDPKHMSDLDHDDIGSDEPIHAWVHDHIANSSNQYHINNGIEQFSPTDSLVALDKIHKAVHKSEDGDHKALKTIHGKLIDHILNQRTPEWDAVKTHALDHMFDDKNIEYYHGHRHNTLKDNSNVMAYNHYVTMTKHPRMMHRIMQYEDDHLPGSESSASHITGVDHIAHFADSKLAHHMMVEHPEMDDWKKLSHFASTLNANKDGEHIQHTLLNQMHLDSGDEHTERNRLMYAAIANKTSFKSVHDRIKSRLSSDLNDPEIRDDHKSNPHFKYDTQMEAYLRFLKK